MLDYIAFFAAVKHSSETEEFMIKSLLNYEVGSYLIVRETSANSHKLTNGEHYHFLVQMEDADYTRYRKSVFIDHFKLCGRSTKDKVRAYGKVNYLKDPDRMAVYMMKDDSVVASTFSDSQLNSWYEKSFKKSEQKGYKDFLKIYVDENLDVGLQGSSDDVFVRICMLQVKYNRIIAQQTKSSDNPMGGMKNSLTKAQLTNFSNWYLLYHYKRPSPHPDPYIYNDKDMVYHLLGLPNI